MSMSRSGSVAPRAHLDSLTGLRGIAAWFVVLFHLRGSLETLLPHSVLAVAAKGYLAVDLFFVLSGFVLWWNYSDRLRSGDSGERLNFFWRRIARIWPLHAFVLCLFIAFAGVLAWTGRSTASYPLAELPLHFLLMHNWGLTTDLSWNDPSWSISTELAAYAVFPIVVCLVRWDRLSSPALIATGLGLAAFVYAMFAAQGSTGLGDLIPQLGIWRCIAQFLMGSVACILWLRWRGREAAWLPVAAPGAVLLAAGFLFDLPETALVPVVFTSLILALALGKGMVPQILSARPAVYLGEISYSTYLVHYLLWIVFKILFVDDTLQLSWGTFSLFVLMLFAASVALYHCVERPAQRWLNRHVPHMRRASPAE